MYIWFQYKFTRICILNFLLKTKLHHYHIYKWLKFATVSFYNSLTKLDLIRQQVKLKKLIFIQFHIFYTTIMHMGREYNISSLFLFILIAYSLVEENVRLSDMFR